MSKPTLQIEFDNQKALEHFAVWLCESGEQDYFQWMECRETEEEGPITVLKFKYHKENENFAVNDAHRYGKFLEENVIETVCGRKHRTAIISAQLKHE